MYDKIEVLDCGTVIQHGKINDRIYLMSKGNIASEALIENLILFANSEGYSKIIVKAESSDLAKFINRGFGVEAFIPKYYPNNNDLFYLTYYLEEGRMNEQSVGAYFSVLSSAQSKNNVDRTPPDIFGTLRQCTEEDVEQMANMYRKVFHTYPFPIFETKYILDTMRKHIDYYCVEVDNKIVALSSAEIDVKTYSAEMTDFATIPEFRSKGYASRLLGLMESNTSQKGINTFYTIARASSYGMNITFSKAGYCFGGRLKNNTNISGQIESMNVWYKDRRNN